MPAHGNGLRRHPAGDGSRPIGEPFDERRARKAIQSTQTRYLVARDTDNLPRVATTFTEDAILETDHDRFLGRREIMLAISGRIRPRVAGQRRPTSLFRRQLTTTEISFAGASVAQVLSTFIAFNGRGTDHSGRYIDTYVLVGGQWLVAHRRVHVESVSRRSRGESRDATQARLLG